MDLPFLPGTFRQIPPLTHRISRRLFCSFATTSELTMADDPSAGSDEWMLTPSTWIALGSGPPTRGGGISVFDASAFPMDSETAWPFTAIQIIYSLTSVRFLVTC
jgi:hypothetical protein